MKFQVKRQVKGGFHSNFSCTLNATILNASTFLKIFNSVQCSLDGINLVGSWISAGKKRKYTGLLSSHNRAEMNSFLNSCDFNKLSPRAMTFEK